MNAPLAPTICDPGHGFGIRVRMDHPKALPAADADCRCGQFAGAATGEVAVQNLVIRAERHMRDECSIPEVRKAAALRDYRRKHPTKRK
ncbi:hypothetical protein ACIQPP_05395 [Streptomyces violaceusniger]|uniref:hypothetical protein n=1 Tax=Streptomyces violaceusniger TaxID=68280 RepID=UPI00099676B9|nr:hypothetical protein [Streptomyces hygroscopicus]AQW55255.1 hypothetical protein SHXM_08718 [Streptomyces hygroscopicus]